MQQELRVGAGIYSKWCPFSLPHSRDGCTAPPLRPRGPHAHPASGESWLQARHCFMFWKMQRQAPTLEDSNLTEERNNHPVGAHHGLGPWRILAYYFIQSSESTRQILNICIFLMRKQPQTTGTNLTLKLVLFSRNQAASKQ